MDFDFKYLNNFLFIFKMKNNNQENFFPNISNQRNLTNINQNNSEDIELKDLTEIDIFSNKYGFDDSFIEKMLKPDCKWNEKKKAFDDLTKLTEPGKIKYIKNTDRTNFIEMIKKLLKQPNINVVHSIINALNNLSLLLKNNFTEAKDLYPNLLIYLKEKKESIINSLIECLSNFSLFMNDSIINEKLITYCSNKHLCNFAKINLCSLIKEIFDKKNNNIQLNSYFNLLIKISKYLEDQNPEVREKSSKLMAYINFIKKDLFNSIVNSIKLDNKKKDKIFEYEKLYINLSYKNNVQNYENSHNKNKEKINEYKNDLQTNIGKKLMDFDNMNRTNKKENKNKTKINNFILDDNNISIIKENLIKNKEEIISYIQKKIINLNNSLFNSLKWEERKEGFSILNNFISDENNLNEIKKEYDYYFKYILINNKFFNEKNFLVLNESIYCINILIEKIEGFSQKYYKIIISLLTNKLNEKKLVTEIQNIMGILLEKISKKNILITFVNSLEKKDINIVKEGLGILKNIINESNEINDCPIQEIINFCLDFLNNSNIALKKSSIQLLNYIYKKIGNEIDFYLPNLNKNLLSMIKEEFNEKENNENNFDDNNYKLSNEIDISDKVDEKMIKVLKDGKWFEKKEVIEQIERIISQYNHNVIIKGLNDLFYEIKNNLNDGNKNIVKLTIKLVDEFLDALEPNNNLKNFVSIVIPSLISNFSENKNSIKDLSVNCVNKIISLIGIESIINDFALQLKTENFDIKNEILKMILNSKDIILNQKENKDLLYSLINCILDKNINIRNNAKIIIQEMMQYISPNLITDYINKLKPSYIKQINDIIYDKSSNNISKSKSIKSNENNYPKTGKKISSKNITNISKQSQTSSKINLNSPFKRNNLEVEKDYSSKKSVSKSPILPINTNDVDNKFNFNVIDVLPPELNELLNYIQLLDSDDIPLKIMSLSEIKKILIHLEDNKDFDSNYINDILNSFNRLLFSWNLKIKSQKEAIDKNDISLIRYLLDDYIFLASKKILINSISDENLIYNCYEKLFILLSSNEVKLLSNGCEILSIINTTILCLLTNLSKTLTIISLIKLISLYKSNQDYPLISSLAIKCLDKIIKIFPKIKNNIDNNPIFITIYNFFLEFSQMNQNLQPNNEKENNALLMIDELIKQYIYIYGDDIWNIYQNSLDDNMLKFDVYFKREIELLYKEINLDKIIKNNSNKSLGGITNFDNNDDNFKEIMNYVNELKNNGINMNEQERNNCYFEIVSLLRINNLDISILKDKIDNDIKDKIFELYYGIKEDIDSKKSIQFSQLNGEDSNSQFIFPENNDYDIKKPKKISEQSKRILDYKNKIKYLTESDSLRNNNTSIKENDENKQMNDNIFIQDKMKQLEEITQQNKSKKKNSPNINNNNNIFDKLSNKKIKIGKKYID